MSTPTRAPLARHLAVAAFAGALVLAPATTAFAEPSPSPSPTTTTSTATPTATPSASDSPTATATAGPSATSTAAPNTPAATHTAVKPEAALTAPAPSSSDADAVKKAPAAARSLVPGGTSRVFGRAAAAGPALSTDSTLLGAHYLEQQLVDSDYLFLNSGFSDYGLTADAVLALDAAGTGQDAAAEAAAKLAEEPVAYTGFGNPAEVYAGAVAKLLNVAAAQGIDPTAFGGVDLVATLQGLEQANGRFSDTSEFGDYSNTFGQSFALIGLSRAGSGPDAAAIDFTEAQQCPGGGFALAMSDAGCTDDSLADPDSTSMAVQALIAAGGDAAAINDALDYLASQQQGDGGVGGSGPTSATNANSTGLAGQAFLAGGRSAQARLAVDYLSALQYDCTFSEAVRGGIAYDAAAFESQQAAGADAVPSDQDNRSTSQALLALAGTPLGTVTSAGADAVAPEPDCALASPSASPSASASATPTSGSGPSSTIDPTLAAGSSGSTGTGSLAQTGSDLLLPVGLGALLVVLGAAAVLASRRKGAHA